MHFDATVAAGATSVVTDCVDPVVRGSAVLGEAVVALGEEGLVGMGTMGFVVDVRRVAVVVTRATALGFVVDGTDVIALEAFVDSD